MEVYDELVGTLLFIRGASAEYDNMVLHYSPRFGWFWKARFVEELLVGFSRCC